VCSICDEPRCFATRLEDIEAATPNRLRRWSGWRSPADVKTDRSAMPRTSRARLDIAQIGLQSADSSEPDRRRSCGNPSMLGGGGGALPPEFRRKDKAEVWAGRAKG